MNLIESETQLRKLIAAWDDCEACLEQTDIDAIKTLLKEISLKNDEYEILRVTSELLEEEQRREIYELQRTLNKAKEMFNNHYKNIKGIDRKKYLAILDGEYEEEEK